MHRITELQVRDSFHLTEGQLNRNFFADILSMSAITTTIR